MALVKSDLLESAGFLHAFTERGFDMAAVVERLGVGDAGGIAQTKQVHGARVVDAHLATAGVEADALVARMGRTPIAVGVRVADCVPVLVGDTENGDVLAIHAGWRGVVAGVVLRALEQLQGRALVVAIGPCIGACCFEVGADVATSIAAAAREPSVIDRVVGEKAFVSLRAAVRHQIMQATGGQARIEDVPGCTKHEPDRFHSFRRDGAHSGRMLAAITARVLT